MSSMARTRERSRRSYSICMCRASSSAISAPLCRSHARPPRADAALERRDDLEEDESEDRHEERPEEEPVRLQRLAGLEDHVPEPGVRLIELADDRARDRSPDRDALPHEDERPHAWNDDR